MPRAVQNVRAVSTAEHFRIATAACDGSMQAVPLALARAACRTRAGTSYAGWRSHGPAAFASALRVAAVAKSAREMEVRACA